jgi:hypothetical protein
MRGDFNLIYQAEDKSNARLHRGLMRRFRQTLDTLQLAELHLSDRRFTWSNERDVPTLERLDRAVASVDWLEDHPHYLLRPLSSDSSDHAPLLLLMNTEPWGRPRFRFEDIWRKFDGFLCVVQVSWSQPLSDVDCSRRIDIKLRHKAKALKNWSASHVGSVRLQLAAARAIILELDIAQESRLLSPLKSSCASNSRSKLSVSRRWRGRLHVKGHVCASLLRDMRTHASSISKRATGIGR